MFKGIDGELMRYLSGFDYERTDTNEQSEADRYEKRFAYFVGEGLAEQLTHRITRSKHQEEIEKGGK